jgi:hypothetical protein
MAVTLSTLPAGCPLPPWRFLVLISVRGWVDPRAIVLLEGLGQLKKSKNLIGNWNRDLPACSIVPQRTTLPRALFHYLNNEWYSMRRPEEVPIRKRKNLGFRWNSIMATVVLVSKVLTSEPGKHKDVPIFFNEVYEGRSHMRTTWCRISNSINFNFYDL